MTHPSHAFLDGRNIPYEKLTFPTSTEKGAGNVAKALGYAEQQMVKTLIFELGTGEHVLVMLPGDKSAKSGLLKKAVGNRNVRMAKPDKIEALTGYVIGSIPAFHWQPEGFRSFIAAVLMEEEILGVGVGEWGHEIMITPENLVLATGAEVVQLIPPA